MSRTMPTECAHGAIIDWGDFGCCDFSPPERCDPCGMPSANHEHPEWDEVTVCSSCKTEACWQGDMYCDEARYAGAVEATRCRRCGRTDGTHDGSIAHLGTEASA